MKKKVPRIGGLASYSFPIIALVIVLVVNTLAIEALWSSLNGYSIAYSSFNLGGISSLIIIGLFLSGVTNLFFEGPSIIISSLQAIKIKKECHPITYSQLEQAQKIFKCKKADIYLIKGKELNAFSIKTPNHPRTIFISEACLNQLTANELLALIGRELSFPSKMNDTTKILWCAFLRSTGLIFHHSRLIIKQFSIKKPLCPENMISIFGLSLFFIGLPAYVMGSICAYGMLDYRLSQKIDHFTSVQLGESKGLIHLLKCVKKNPFTDLPPTFEAFSKFALQDQRFINSILPKHLSINSRIQGLKKLNLTWKFK